MITVSTMGHLGNNMFQIAAAYSLANHHKTECGYIRKNKISAVECFKLEGLLETDKKSSHFYKENAFSYNNNFLNLSRKTHLDGYFQSYKYFNLISDNVQSLFTFKDSSLDSIHEPNNKHYLELITCGDEKTFLHVRRGDYMKYPDVYPIINKNYYNKCLEISGNNNLTFVFSDDIQWCKDNFDKRYIYVELNSFVSLWMMMLCDNAIIANSTFSWWGAWMGKKKRVFRPKIWFNHNWPYKHIHKTVEECTKDLCPPHWEAV